MTLGRIGTVAVIALALTGCGNNDAKTADEATPATNTPTSSAPSQKTDSGELRTAVQAYSDAFLTGNDGKAYDLLSDRCQERTSAGEFGAIVAGAQAAYGNALPFKTFDADEQGTMARVTYTYDVSAINQTDEPWVDEGGWKNDDC